MYAEVIVDVLSSEVDKVFDYEIPADMSVKLGSRVMVPFGNRKIEGYVLNIKQTSTLQIDKIKQILKVFENVPEIKPELIFMCYKMKELFHLRLIDGIRRG